MATRPALSNTFLWMHRKKGVLRNQLTLQRSSQFSAACSTALTPNTNKPCCLSFRLVYSCGVTKCAMSKLAALFRYAGLELRSALSTSSHQGSGCGGHSFISAKKSPLLLELRRTLAVIHLSTVCGKPSKFQPGPISSSGPEHPACLLNLRRGLARLQYSLKKQMDFLNSTSKRKICYFLGLM